MTNEEVIAYLTLIMESTTLKTYRDAVGTALAALRAQQEPRKLDRSRWEGCDCCKGDLEGYTAQFRDVEKRSRPLYIPEGGGNDCCAREI